MTFGGGQIDVLHLLRALEGRPLQARIQETFTASTGGVEERAGRLLVSSRGWARFDVQEASAPGVSFAYDLRRGLIGGGLADAPESWTWWPWAAASRIQPGAAEESRPAPLPADAVLVEGVPCRVTEYRGGETTTREWYALELGLAMRMETTSPEGRRLFRIHEVRRDEPDAAEWPTRQW